MTRKKTSVMAIAVIAAAAVSASVLIFFSMSPDDRVPPADPPNGDGPIAPSPQPPVQKTTLNVLSSPSAFPFVDRWVAQYNNGDNAGNVQLVYSRDADDINMALLYSSIPNFLAEHSADIAITGRAVAPTDDFTYEGSIFLPVSSQAIAIVYNIPGFPDVPSGLRLDQPTLYAILSGNATHWNDQRIAELNSGLNLPNEPIVVVHERRPDSASELLQRYLDQNGIVWSESGLTADSPDALSATVRQTPFSIGYVDFSHAVQTRMTYAALANSDGQYILPSASSVARAVQNGTVIAGGDSSVVTVAQGSSMPPTTLVGQLGNGSYPIVGFYYLAFADPHRPTSDIVPEKAAASLDFARWVSGPAGQRLLGDVQYPSIYEQSELLRSMADDLAADRMPGARFENATNFTNNTNDSVYGQVAAVDDNVYIVWQESVSGTNYDIFFKRSEDRGNTFDDSVINLSRNPGFSEHPQIAASGTGVYVVWADNTAGNKQVMFAKSTDSGNTFDSATVLSDPDFMSYNHEVAAFGDNVYVVWQERRNGMESIVFRASSDGASTFQDPITLAPNADLSSFPKVAADESAVHVVWSTPAEPGLHYVRSADEGATFSAVVQLNNGNKVGEAQVAAYRDSVYVVWGGLHSHEVDRLFFVASSDNGLSFTEPASIESDMLVNPMNVELAIMPVQNSDPDPDAYDYLLHIFAEVTKSPGRDEILLISSANGDGFTEPLNLSNTEGISECPSIAISGDSIFVIWEDRTVGHNEIFFTKGIMH